MSRSGTSVASPSASRSARGRPNSPGVGTRNRMSSPAGMANLAPVLRRVTRWSGLPGGAILRQRLGGTGARGRRARGARRGRRGSRLSLFVQQRQVVAGLRVEPVSYTHLRAHETVLDLVCRLLLEKKKKKNKKKT